MWNFWAKKEPQFISRLDGEVINPDAEIVEVKMPEPTKEEILCQIKCTTQQLKCEHREGMTSKTDLFRKRFAALLDALNGFDWCDIPLMKEYGGSYGFYVTYSLHLTKNCSTVRLSVADYGPTAFCSSPRREEYDPYDPCLFERKDGKYIVYHFTDHYEDILKNVKKFRQNQLDELNTYKKAE
jgi:hypothetical protein